MTTSASPTIGLEIPSAIAALSRFSSLGFLRHLGSWLPPIGQHSTVILLGKVGLINESA